VEEPLPSWWTGTDWEESLPHRRRQLTTSSWLQKGTIE
jgi:hypothetical protein